jgi:rSAM/selenodomain-associated transferase 2
MRLSVVIPALNAAATLAATLAAVVGGVRGVERPPHPNPLPSGERESSRRHHAPAPSPHWGEGWGEGAPGPHEIIVVDGGSADATAAIAHHYGARAISAPRGRGTQLATGAAHATGEWLLFLHADTHPAPGWYAAVQAFTADSENMMRAGYFRFALDDPSPRARALERRVAWRAAKLGLPYGDQGLLLSRALYDVVGGYAAIPLMEDVDLVRRIGRERLAAIPVDFTTDARKFRGRYRVRSARNLTILSLYFLGVPPRMLAKLY